MSTHLVKRPTDGDVLDRGQPEHRERADESEQGRREDGGHEHDEHPTQGGATTQHVGEVALEEEQRVVAEPRQLTRDDVDDRQVDEERVVDGVATPRGVGDGDQGGGVGHRADDREDALDAEAGR